MWSSVIAPVVSILTALIAAWVSFRVARDSAKSDLRQAEDRLRQDYAVEFAAEKVARALMTDSEWNWRSFKVIQHHLGGFSEDELRRLLVRAGAIRATAKDGSELWGLLERNGDLIGLESVEAGRKTRITPAGQIQQQQQ
jgi:hypothetical protein